MKYSISTFKNWLGRVKYYGIRNSLSLFHNLKKDGCFALRHFGNDFYLRGNTVDFAVFNSIFAKGEYDLDIGFNPEYIIDAGAYIGVSTVYFRHKYPEAKIIAVEPEKSNFDLLVRNTKPYKSIFCVNAGIYGEDVPLVISDHAAEKYAFRVERSNFTEESVPGYMIKTLMEEFQLPHIDILKMDIEGAEYSVFAHDPDAWLTGVRVLVAELHEFIHPGVSELVLGVLKDSGFKLLWKGENLIACKDISANFNTIALLD
jgi:FkbM family methyltransferase